VEARLGKFLAKIEKKYHQLPPDLHITRKAGALVAISDGKPIMIEKPSVKYCPLFKILFGNSNIDQASIAEKFRTQVEKWGMFTANRKVTDCSIVVPFGASEMIMYALDKNGVDTAVLVCEGAGSVITSSPEVVQGIGAYMNGVFYTTPIARIMENLKKKGTVLLSEKAEINQFKAVKLAYSRGYRQLVVTVRGDQIGQIKKMRDFQLRSPGLKTIIMAVCNTGISSNQARAIRDNADLAWACASSKIREIVAPASMLQVGMKIPVFVITGQGIDFLSNYYDQQRAPDLLKEGKTKKYITSNRCHPGGTRFRMGRFSVYAYPTESLPVNASDQPRPYI